MYVYILFCNVQFFKNNDQNRFKNDSNTCGKRKRIILDVSVPTEVKLLKKEHFNHWYSLRSYYSAYQISRLPLMVCITTTLFLWYWTFKFISIFLCFQLIMTMFFVSVLYNMIGLPAEINRFLLVYLICCTTSIAAEGIGLAIGSVFSVIVSTVITRFKCQWT